MDSRSVGTGTPPVDDSDSLARRRERIAITTHDHDTLSADGFHREVRPFTIDLRI
jgi:hypothetical protein